MQERFANKREEKWPRFLLDWIWIYNFSVIKGFYSNIKSSIFLKDELLFLYIG